MRSGVAPLRYRGPMATYGARWRTPDVEGRTIADHALLPQSLRELWSTERMPDPVARELGLPSGSCLGALLPGVRTRSGGGPTAILDRYLGHLLWSRRSGLRAVRVFTQPWPPSLDPLSLPLRTRTSNSLRGQAGRRLASIPLTHLTYGQLFEIPRMGVVSILDFACVGEAAIRSAQARRSGHAEVPPDLDQDEDEAGAAPWMDALQEVLALPWARQVSSQDPRFRGIWPFGPSTAYEVAEWLLQRPFEDLRTVQRAAASMQAVGRRAAALSVQPLEEALRDLLKAVSKLDERKFEALVARLGWGGRPPITLAESALIAGVTGERMRQIQSLVLDRLPEHPVYLPALDRALELLAAAAPIDVAGSAELLRRECATRVAFHPAGLLRAAAACRRPETLRIVAWGGEVRVVAASVAAQAGEIIRYAHLQAAASGATNVEEVVAEVRSALREPLTTRDVRSLLSGRPEVHFLDENWFWADSAERGVFFSLARKILSVTSPMPSNALWDAMSRFFPRRPTRARSKVRRVVPPLSVLTQVLRAHPAFVVDAQERVLSAEPLDYRAELSGVEAALVEIMRASPGCVLNRETWRKAAIDRGINLNTFSHYLTYSPVFAHLGKDVSSLCGAQVDPVAAEAVRRANALRKRERQVVDAVRRQVVRENRHVGTPASTE